MFRGYETRKDDNASFSNRKIMVASPKTTPTKFHDSQSAAFRPIDGRKLLQRNDPMRDTVQLEIGVVRSAIIEKQYTAFATNKKLLEGEDLTPISKGVLGQKP